MCFKMCWLVPIVMILGLYSTTGQGESRVSSDTLDRERRTQEVSDCNSEPYFHKDCSYLSAGKRRMKTLAGREFCARCEHDGSLVIQRRPNGMVSFNTYWYAYKHGFGDLDGGYWLGNDLIYEITNSGRYQLKISIQSWDSKWFRRTYDNFYIENEAGNYKVHFEGTSGNMPDSFSYHSGMNFSTPDRDNDNSPEYHCAKYGGFWFNSCSKANLNGLYWKGGNATLLNGTYSGIEWEDVDQKYPNNSYSFKRSQMEIKPMPMDN